MSLTALLHMSCAHQVEIWDLGGNRSTAQMDKLTHNPSGATVHAMMNSSAGLH